MPPPLDLDAASAAMLRAAVLASGRAKLPWRGAGWRHGVASAPPPLSAAGESYAAEMRRIAAEWATTRHAQDGTPATAVLAAAAATARAAARRTAATRAVNALVTLASGAGDAAGLGTCCAALEALVALSRPGLRPAHASLARAGALDAAACAAVRFPSSARVAALSCTLAAHMAGAAPLLLRMHTRAGGAADRALAACLACGASFPDDVAVASAAAGALWALVLSRGAATQALALRAGALPLLLSALRRHALNADAVHNAAGALVVLSTGEGGAGAAAALWAERETLRDALRRHGGVAGLFGPAVAAAAPWAAPTDAAAAAAVAAAAAAAAAAPPRAQPHASRQQRAAALVAQAAAAQQQQQRPGSAASARWSAPRSDSDAGAGSLDDLR